jgi:hypothetical protein
MRDDGTKVTTYVKIFSSFMSNYVIEYFVEHCTNLFPFDRDLRHVPRAGKLLLFAGLLAAGYLLFFSWLSRIITCISCVQLTILVGLLMTSLCLIL